MVIFPKLPALRGRRALYEVNGYVSGLPPRFVGDDTQASARVHRRDANGAAVELAVLNFVTYHGAAAYGGIKLEKVDNNGYHWVIARWYKAGGKWKRS